MKYIIDTDKLPCNNGMNCTTCPFWPIDAICEIKEQVKNLPKYEERPHGEWIKTGRTNIYDGFEIECSHCHNKLMVSPKRWEVGENFCDVCGSRNKKEGEAE